VGEPEKGETKSKPLQNEGAGNRTNVCPMPTSAQGRELSPNLQ